MAKQGMKRPETDKNKPPKNDVAPVPQLQGAARKKKEKADPAAQ